CLMPEKKTHRKEHNSYIPNKRVREREYVRVRECKDKIHSTVVVRRIIALLKGQSYQEQPHLLTTDGIRVFQLDVSSTPKIQTLKAIDFDLTCISFAAERVRNVGKADERGHVTCSSGTATCWIYGVAISIRSQSDATPSVVVSECIELKLITNSSNNCTTSGQDEMGESGAACFNRQRHTGLYSHKLTGLCGSDSPACSTCVALNDVADDDDVHMTVTLTEIYWSTALHG
ncbi:hypothetical protein CLF_106599, partial [Clonorchis sinensis]